MAGNNPSFDATGNMNVSFGNAVVDVILSTDTSIYAAGDVLADTQVMANFTKLADYGAEVKTITVIDRDDQGAAIDIYLLNANVSMGTENAAPSITDPNAGNIMARISVLTTDYFDLGGVRVAHVRGLATPVIPATGTTSVYVAAVVGAASTPTYTAAGLTLRFGIARQ